MSFFTGQPAFEHHISAYAAHLRTHEYAHGTVDKYLRDVRSFVSWLADHSGTSQSAPTAASKNSASSGDCSAAPSAS